MDKKLFRGRCYLDIEKSRESKFDLYEVYMGDVLVAFMYLPAGSPYTPISTILRRDEKIEVHTIY